MPTPTAVATLHTNHGDIVVNLFGDHAPRTVSNFIGLSDGTGEWKDPSTGRPGDGPLYKDVVFHRIIPGFVAQCGDPTGTGSGPNPGYRFADDLPAEGDYEIGSLAMANCRRRMRFRIRASAMIKARIRSSDERLTPALSCEPRLLASRPCCAVRRGSSAEAPCSAVRPCRAPLS